MSLSSRAGRDRYELEPPLITNLSQNREKRRLVRFDEIPIPSPSRPPAGIASAEIDPESGDLADGSSPDARVEYCVTGTEPNQYCRLHPMVPASP